MARKMFFVLLVGFVLLSGTVYAAQPDMKAAEKDPTIQVIRADEAYGVRDGKLHKFDADRGSWVTRHAKAVTYDTIVHFTAEGPSWNDRIMTSAEWDTIDATDIPSMWHISDFKACSDDSAWLCNDPSIGTQGGYADDWWQMLTTDWIADIGDSTFLVYDHWVKCEHNDAFPWSYGWDAYQVRVAVKGKDFAEVKPYQVADDASLYRGGRFYGEWDTTWAMGYHGSTGGGFGWNKELTCSFKTFDLRPFAGDTIAVRFIFASDGGWNTADEDSLFGLILDNLLVAEGLDSTILANLPVVGGDTLFYEDNEDGGSNQLTPDVLAPTGSYWWLAFGGYGGSSYKAMSSDPFSGKWAPNVEDRLASPWIKKADLDTNMADLLLDYYLRGNFNDPDPFPEIDYVYNEYRLDDKPWAGVSLLTDVSNWVYSDFDDSDWWDIEQWSESMHDLTPLLDSAGWDSMQVAVHVHTDGDTADAGAVGFQIDEFLVYGRIGFPNDIGVSAVKLPGPNANDMTLTIDTVAVENLGFNPAASGNYSVHMAIVDSNGTIIDGPKTISAIPTPQIDPLEIEMVPCDPTTNFFTLDEEGSYDFLIWTVHGAGDDDPANDTLATEYTAKALYYPGVYNYPAGQGQIRYHDQGLYNYPFINIRRMDSLEVAAVRFDPDPSLYPFDCRLALPNMVQLAGSPVYNLKVYGPGMDDDHPGAVWYTIPFSGDGSTDLASVRIELDTLDMLQHMSGDFWLGIEFPNGTDEEYVMGTESAENTSAGRNWGHSYLYTDTTGTKQMDWTPYDYDWYLTCVISWRMIDAESMPSLSGPPKNASGNLYLDWADVSQAKDYLIYRGTDIDSTFPFLDSTAVATSNYTDVGAVGDVNTSYFYLFNTRHQDGGVYDKTSAAIGEFDKSLGNVK